MLVIGRQVIPRVLHYVAQTGSRELFRLAILSLALGVAYGAVELFSASFALARASTGRIGPGDTGARGGGNQSADHDS